MIKKIMTAVLFGIEAVPVEVEADVSNGLPATIIVGLPDASVQESRERVRSAIRNSGFAYPQTRVSINLAPADVQKNGTHFDLAIAVAILSAAELIECDSDQALFIGELSLDGKLRPCQGVVAMAELARHCGYKQLFVPAANAEEAVLIAGIEVVAVESLQQLMLHFLGTRLLVPYVKKTKRSVGITQALLDFADIAGQNLAKRALEIAAAGNHNIRLIGPPGSGKTMLAKALPGLLPELSMEEQLVQLKIAGASGKISAKPNAQRPFRAPHHTSSAIALIGGGSTPSPGEVTLAHNGILFLDEFPEFSRNVLEVLRQPLEDGCVSIARAKHSLNFPARFLLVAAQNPCPCGNFGEAALTCRCLPTEIQKYNKKLSGPLLDRIDLHIHVPRMSFKEIHHGKGKETSAEVARRVADARRIQTHRFGVVKTNSAMTAKEVQQFCQLEVLAESTLQAMVEKFQLSGRSVHRILKVARTIADLELSADHNLSSSFSRQTAAVGNQPIKQNQLLEALQYRLMQEQR